MSNNAKPVPAGTGIMSKLFQVQQQFKTFAISEDSDKREANGKPTYKYTPGWEITEKFREAFDAIHLMLIPEYRFNKVETIEYPVYKLIGGTPMSFPKREIHVTVDADFTFVDVDSGETKGPFHFVAAGANGTDKSTASAIALAERYFLLKFFHVSTREATDEPDAHDSDYVPGIPKKDQQGATPQNACMAAPVRQGSAPRYDGTAQPYGPRPQPQGYQGGFNQQGYIPQGGGQPQPGQQVNVFTAPPAYAPATPAAGHGIPFNENNELISQVVERLMNFDKGTISHSQQLNEAVAYLSANGVICTDPNFITNLTECAQARRENRQPRYV